MIKLMQVTVVNDKDEPIGSKPIGELGPSDIYRVASLWLTNTSGQILLAQRQLGKRNDPGKWGPAVAGTVESNETYEQNIYKEAEEEIGLSGFSFSLGPKFLNDANPGRKFFVQWFLCSCDWPIERFKIQKEEVEQLTWVSKTDLAKDLGLNPQKYIAGSEIVWSKFL